MMEHGPADVIVLAQGEAAWRAVLIPLAQHPDFWSSFFVVKVGWRLQ